MRDLFWLVLICLAGMLSACSTVPVNRPCGVIRDSLIDVNATTPDGQRRLNAHHERGAAAGCWK